MTFVPPVLSGVSLASLVAVGITVLLGAGVGVTVTASCALVCWLVSVMRMAKTRPMLKVRRSKGCWNGLVDSWVSLIKLFFCLDYANLHRLHSTHFTVCQRESEFSHSLFNWAVICMEQNPPDGVYSRVSDGHFCRLCIDYAKTQHINLHHNDYPPFPHRKRHRKRIACSIIVGILVFNV